MSFIKDYVLQTGFCLHIRAETTQLGKRKSYRLSPGRTVIVTLTYHCHEPVAPAQFTRLTGASNVPSNLWGRSHCMNAHNRSIVILNQMHIDTIRNAGNDDVPTTNTMYRCYVSLFVYIIYMHENKMLFYN
jgi:hypothetical protein